MSRPSRSRTNGRNLQRKQLNVSVINSHDAAGLEEEMIIYRSQMQPAKWKNMKNRIFQDRRCWSLNFFFPPFYIQIAIFCADLCDHCLLSCCLKACEVEHKLLEPGESALASDVEMFFDDADSSKVVNCQLKMEGNYCKGQWTKAANHCSSPMHVALLLLFALFDLMILMKAVCRMQEIQKSQFAVQQKEIITWLSLKTLYFCLNSLNLLLRPGLCSVGWFLFRGLNTVSKGNGVIIPNSSFWESLPAEVRTGEWVMDESLTRLQTENKK